MASLLTALEKTISNRRKEQLWPIFSCNCSSFFRPKITRSENSSKFGSPFLIRQPAAPLCSQFWQLPNTFMVRKCSLANIGALTFTSKVSCWSLIWFSSMSSLSSGGPLFSLSRTEYQAGRECPISRFGEKVRSLRRKKPCRHQPQVANDSGYQAESSL